MDEPLEPMGEAIDLDVLFAADLPPAHDADFIVGVMRTAARRKMMWELAGTALMAGISALILWAVGPVLAPVLKPVSTTLLLFMPVLATVAAIILVVHPRTAV